MRKIVYLIAVSFAFLPVNAQIYVEDAFFKTEIIYRYTFVNDSLQTKAPDNRNMSLLVNEDFSLFQLTSRFVGDSTWLARNELATAVASQTIAPVSNINYQIFKTEDKITTVEAVNGFDIHMANVFHVYQETDDVFDWKIKEDTMVINHLLCRKAELEWRGRSWEAWFAPSVPIFDGPYKFRGLPGLIVHIRDGQGYFTFEMESMSNVHKHHRPVPKMGLSFKQTNRDEFFELRKYFRDNMYEVAVSEGLAPNEDAKKQALQSAKTDNNHIEVH